MKSSVFSFISVFLAAVLMLPVFVACGTGGADISGSDSTTSSPPDTDPVPDESTPQSTEVTTPAGTEAAEEKELRVLFIGNSLTYYNNMPETVEKLGLLAGKKIVVESATQGSGTMTEQISGTTAVGQKVRAYLTEKWDYVVIQPSRRITEKDATVKAAELEAGKELDRMIKAAGAKTLIYCTWGNNTGTSNVYTMVSGSIDSKVTGSFSISQDDHSKYMQSVCREYCDLLGAETVACAELFRYLMTDQKAYNVYYTDNRHPSVYGSFAVACAFYAYLFNESPVDVAKKYTGITPAGSAEILAAAASHIVLNTAAPEAHNTASSIAAEKDYSHLKTAAYKGSGTEADPYIISTAEEFNYFALASEKDSFSGKYFKQTADIFFDGVEIRPVGDKTAFAGTYDGCGLKIGYFSITTDEIAGLFCKTLGATIKNVNITCATILSKTAGALAGFAANKTLIENCSVDHGSSSTGSHGVGGLVGLLSASTITGCNNAAPVFGISTGDHLYCGGICGIAGGNSLIILCENTGEVTAYQDVSAKNGCAGGILGVQGISASSMANETVGPCNIEKCVNRGTAACTYGGDIESRPYCGGIAGRGAHVDAAAHISDCANFGSLINNGKNKYYGSGQICGVYVYPKITLSNCYGTDAVSAAFAAQNGADAQGSNYLVGKFGSKFSASQYIKPSDTIALLTAEKLEEWVKANIK